MKQNVAQALESDAKSLYERLSSNQQVAGVMMGFLGRIIVECAKMGKPIEGVSCGDVFETNGEFRFRIDYSTLSTSTSFGLWGFHDDLLRFVEGKSMHMANALARNPKLLRSMSNVVEAIDQFCRQKGKTFEEFEVKKAFLSKDNRTCVIVPGKQSLDRFGR